MAQLRDQVTFHDHLIAFKGAGTHVGGGVVPQPVLEVLPNLELGWLYVFAGIKGVLKLGQLPLGFLLCTFDCDPLLTAPAGSWVPPHVEDDAPASLRPLGDGLSCGFSSQLEVLLAVALIFFRIYRTPPQQNLG